MKFGHVMASMLALITPVVSPAEAQQIAPVRIAVIDSGVAAVGPIAGHLSASYDMTGKARVELSNSHGTSVAAIIAANSRVPIEIISLRADGFVCGRHSLSCQMDRRAIASAFRKAIALHADIVQISSYGALTPDVKKAVAEATAAGIHVVFCAGNQGGIARALPLVKTAGDRLHIVGSLDADGQISKWSARDFGSHRRLEWRLGENVPTFDMEGRPVLMTGTSFAAPLLAAELAGVVYTSKTSAPSYWAADDRTQPRSQPR